MKQNVLEKLEWRFLVGQLASFCKTKAATERSLALFPDLKRETVEERWRLVDPLRQLINLGYNPPLSDLDEITPIFRAISVGQILSGKDLRQIYTLLIIVKSVHKFCSDFSNKCVTLKHVHARTYPLPRIMSEIEKTVDPDGELLDDASPELSEIRKGKLAIRKRIESLIRGLFQDQEMIKYIQDDFYTIRADRYVVPIKLDGRGRIKGSIYDTSDSGQTLFIEPTVVAPLNEELLELELSEKLEILRIFRALGEKIAVELDIIRQNYVELVELDFLTAQANLAKKIDANPVKLAKAPTVQLKDARHPVLALDPERKVVGNHILLDASQKTLVISGPNAGGKTVVLKTVGLMHLMAKAGLLISASPDSEIFLFNDIFLELGDAQNLSANLSTFSGHLMGIKPIIENAGEQDLVLLDEIAAGTEPQAGAALAQAILEHLVEHRCVTVATTHFDSLKGLAIADDRYRNGSMEYSLKNLKPTYRLILDVPGQSYGIELAEHIGLPMALIERAKDLRGSGANRLDEIINDLNAARTQLSEESNRIRQKTFELETAKEHWQREKASLEEARRDAAKKMADRYEDSLSDLKEQYNDVIEEMRKHLKSLESKDAATDKEREAFNDLRQAAKAKLDAINTSIKDVSSHAASPKDDSLTPLAFADLRENLKVFVHSLQQEGTVARVPSSPQQPIDIRLGLLNVRIPLSDLRAAPTKGAAKQERKIHPIKDSVVARQEEIPFTPQTSTNSVDLRGKDALDAVEHMWRFVDQAVRTGEPRVVIIHGHGFNKLKPAIREALAHNPPYQVRFRPGDEKEGGDGVTIVSLDR